MKLRLTIMLLVVVVLGAVSAFIWIPRSPAGPSEQPINVESVRAIFDGWSVSYEEAVAASEEAEKPILAAFVGTDWSRDTDTQAKLVFQHTVFADWAEEKVVMLLVDLPRDESQPAEIAEQNRRLAEQYEVAEEDLPVMVLIEPDGSEVGRLGRLALPGGAGNWTANADRILAGEEVVESSYGGGAPGGPGGGPGGPPGGPPAGADDEAEDAESTEGAADDAEE